MDNLKSRKFDLTTDASVNAAAAWRVYATLLASVEHIVKAVEFAKDANTADDADVQEKTAAMRAALRRIAVLTSSTLDSNSAPVLGQPSASREDI